MATYAVYPAAPQHAVFGLAVSLANQRQLEGVKAGIESDKLYEAQTEIRHLKNTIAALRVELEEMQANRDAAVQAAVAASRDEMLQLQNTIQALRDELQAMVVSKEEVAQAVLAAGRDEARQLQATIATLREELERTIKN